MIIFEPEDATALRSTVHPLTRPISDLRWKDPDHVGEGEFVLTERGWLRSYGHLYLSTKTYGALYMPSKSGELIALPRFYWNSGGDPVVCVGYTDHSMALDADPSEIHQISAVHLDELRPGDAVQLVRSWQVVDRFKIPENPDRVNLKRRKNRPMGEIFDSDGTIDQFELQFIPQESGPPLVEVRRDLTPGDLGFEGPRLKLAMGGYNSFRQGETR